MYKCPRHNLVMELKERVINLGRGRLCREHLITYYGCPVIGCNESKPDKKRKPKKTT